MIHVNKKIIYATATALLLAGLAGCSSSSTPNKSQTQVSQKTTNQSTASHNQNSTESNSNSNSDNQTSASTASTQKTTESNTNSATTTTDKNLGFTVDDLKNRLNTLGQKYTSTSDLKGSATSGRIQAPISVNDGMYIKGDYDIKTGMVKDFNFSGPTDLSKNPTAQTLFFKTMNQVAAASDKGLSADDGQAIIQQLYSQVMSSKTHKTVSQVNGNVKITLDYNNDGTDTLTVSNAQ